MGIATREQRVRDHVEGDQRHVAVDVAQGAMGTFTPLGQQALGRFRNGWHKAEEIIVAEDGCRRLTLPFPVGPVRGQHPIAEQRPQNALREWLCGRIYRAYRGARS